jgi:hypothetical protein
MYTVWASRTRYGPSSTCPPNQSTEPNWPEFVKKCECFRGIAPAHGSARVGFGLPAWKLPTPVDDVCPAQAYGENAARPARFKPATSSSHLFTRCHRPTMPASTGVEVDAAVERVACALPARVPPPHPLIVNTAATTQRNEDPLIQRDPTAVEAIERAHAGSGWASLPA